MDILRLIADARDQVRRRVFPEASRNSVNHESDAELLNDIIGVVIVAHHRPGGPEHQFPVPIDHLAQELVGSSAGPDCSPVVAH
jgi:hypothetical protein